MDTMIIPFRPNKPDEEVQQHQQWFIDLASGKNIRHAKHLPLHLTKRMAHLFSQAPDRKSLFYAFRWAQITAMDSSEELTRAIFRTRLGESFENEAFWVTVIQFFVNNPLLHTDHVGPIVDYIYNQKYVPQEGIQPGGGVLEGPPSHLSFSIKGRSADKLLRQVEDWHGELNAGDYVAFEKWNPSEIRPLQHTETDQTGQTRTWTIHELCTSWELALEGKTMHHCIRSYAGKCVSGECSVWSLQVQVGIEDPTPVMTMAVNNEERRITQARGKYNLLPHRKTGRRRNISGSYLALLKEAPRLMGMWTEQTGLTNGSP